jgi:predicted thioesterase
MSATDAIPIGASATFTLEVRTEFTVKHHHADMPAVFGTPFMIYAMEVAATRAIESYLPQGWVSVGCEVNVRHLAATPLGAMVTTTATVTGKTGRLVNFTVQAHDGIELIGEGTHARAPVDLARLEKRAAAKRAG